MSWGREMWRAVLDLAVPLACVGCHVDGTRWCAACSAEVLAAWGAPRLVTPDPRPSGLPLVAAATPYLPPLTALLHAWKDEGGVAATSLLAPLLRDAARCVVAESAATTELLVVPVPSAPRTTRARGWSPVSALAAAALPGFRTCTALQHARKVTDQAGLGQRSRRVNLAGALSVTSRGRRELPGARVLLVDDIVTTGSTLVEAARACSAAGAVEVYAATVAATQRRAPEERQV